MTVNDTTSNWQPEESKHGSVPSPSPEEIKEETRKIRATWSENKHRERAGKRREPYTIRTVPAPDFDN